MSYLRNVTIKKKPLHFPCFFPDATRGVIRSTDSQDLINTGIEGLVINTYHLFTHPGMATMKNIGGISNFMSWRGWTISDSGGFQLPSLIHGKSSFGSINDNGVIFYKEIRGSKEKYNFTPEKSIQMQFTLNADMMICLDDCPPPNATQEQVEISIRRTVLWAKRCKVEFDKIIKERNLSDEERPVLFAVIQGADDKVLRQKCAEELINIGFDGYGFGGWPLTSQGELNTEILSFVANLMPSHLPKYALGVGNPNAVVECVKMGYTIFDCVLPTRDARHKRIYNFKIAPQELNFSTDSDIYEHLFISQDKYATDSSPLSTYCDCFTCQHYSRAYLHHLFEIEDTLAYRLATIHNLRHYTLLIEQLRKYVSR